LEVRGEPQADSGALSVSGRSECQKAHVLMSKYVDKELDPVERPALKQHLELCETCRIQMKVWKDQAALMSRALDTVLKPRPIRVSPFQR
jgi:anti-sigma factor RsiW